MKTKFVLIALCGFILTCCGNKKPDDSIVTVDLTKNNFQEITLYSNDFVKNWNVVKLETNENCLVRPIDNIYPTDNFIIVYNYDKFLLFDHSGKFLRRIAERGNGPLDINNIYSCLVDSKQESLYWLEWDKLGVIRVYNLKENSFKESIPAASGNPFASLHLINDSTFLCFPQMDNIQLCYVQDLKGDFLDGDEKLEITTGSGSMFKLKVMTFDNEWFYQGNEEDTVYNALSKEPVVVFQKGTNPTLIYSLDEKYYTNILGLFHTSKDYIFSKSEFEIGNGLINAGQRYFVYNWKNKRTKEIKDIYIEPFDKYYKGKEMENFFNIASSFNYKKIVIMVTDESDDENNPTLYIGDLY